jgi:hypothetical protein
VALQPLSWVARGAPSRSSRNRDSLAPVLCQNSILSFAKTRSWHWTSAWRLPVFVWTLHALGVTAMFSLVLSGRGLWSRLRGQARSSNDSNLEKPVARRG